MATQTTKKSAIRTDVFMKTLTLTLTFSNGKEIIVNANDLRQDMRDMAMMAGLKAKLIDAAAMSRNPENGASASVDDKYHAVKKIADRLLSEDGQWNEGRSAAGESTAGANNILLRAVMRMTGRDETYTRDWLNNKTKEQRAALRKNPRVLQIIAELQAATVVGGINTDALLSELGVDADEEGESDDSNDAGDGSGIAQTMQQLAEVVATPEPTTPAPTMQEMAVAMAAAAKKPNTRTNKKKLATTPE